jgi:hypothetical protein
MKWSFSTSRVFFECPRKWYYREVFADSTSDDALRKEAFLLKQLSNLRAWRGKLVDQVISRFLIPALNRHESIDQEKVLKYASDLVRCQMAFGKASNYRKEVSSEFRANPEYCAFFELEYGSTLPEDKVQMCVEEIRHSLKNLLSSDFVKQINEDGVHLIAQRTLKLQFLDLQVRCTPDLIAFLKSRPPTIVDWKVETPNYKDHWTQLGLYGVVLSRIEPHKDFPTQFLDLLKDSENIDLFEFQLLHNKIHKYKIAPDDVIDVENYIYSSASQISRFFNGGSIVDPHSIPSGRNAETCLTCNFRKLCWRAAA